MRFNFVGFVRWLGKARSKIRNQTEAVKIVGNCGLSGAEVVCEIYYLLTNKNIITLVFNPAKDKYDEEGFWAVIGDDTCPGDCRSRKAYMHYAYFRIVSFGGIQYAVGYGRNPAPHYYVGEKYMNDLMILWVPTTKDEEELKHAIEAQWCHVFLNSPIVGLKDGGLQFGSDFDFGETKPGSWLKHVDIQNFALNGRQEKNTDKNLVWKKELPIFLAEKIASHLKEGYEIHLA